MITNSGNISLPMAIWLASDDYDFDPSCNKISATGLLKSVKQIILSSRVQELNLAGDSDLQDAVASSIGTAIHDAVEKAVLNNSEQALIAMGVPPGARDKVRINPTIIDPHYHNISMEQRVEREFMGFIISGKYDIVEQGRVKDIKSTSCYTYIYDTNSVKYSQQGSIYRWLSPQLITDDYMDVEYVFLDWQARSAKDKGYPPTRVLSKTVPLMSLQRTEEFIRGKIDSLITHQQAPEAQMPDCTREELWQKSTTFAYYKTPTAKRATKVGSESELTTRMIADGNVGEVRRRPGKAKHCAYCPAKPICAQAERLAQAGLLA